MAIDRERAYLETIRFSENGTYEVGVDGDGVIVYSECCADRMSEETARKLHDALGRWLADRSSR